ncbi:MAG: hypothetical protein AB1846_00910 [Chloroflexota bacterium]
MDPDLDEKQRRALQYWYVDGAFEFGMGGLCLLLALYFYALAKLEDTWLGGMLSAAMVLVVVGGGMGINRLVMRLKERVTFPRTGYVAYRRTRGAKRLARLVLVGLVAGLVSALLTLLLVRLSSTVMVSIASATPQPVNWMPGLTGLMFAVVVTILGLRTAIPRFYLVAALSLVTGAALMFAGLDMNLGLAAFYAALAAGLLAASVFVLRHYLGSTTPPAEADNESP